MTLSIIAVLLIRLLVPIGILRWPFWGTLASIVADIFDFGVLGTGSSQQIFSDYQSIDKLLDLYYLSFAAIVSSRLSEIWPRRILLSLYSLRFAGVIMFEFAGIRDALFFAPNIFENFFILIYGSKTLFPKLSLNTPKLWASFLLLASTVKLPQEYVMHYLEFPWGFGNFNDGLKTLFRL